MPTSVGQRCSPSNRAAVPLGSSRLPSRPCQYIRVSARGGRLRLHSGMLNSWTPCRQSDQRSSEGRRVHVDAGVRELRRPASSTPTRPAPTARFEHRREAGSRNAFAATSRCRAFALRGRCMARPQAGLRWPRAPARRTVGDVPRSRTGNHPAVAPHAGATRGPTAAGTPRLRAKSGWRSRCSDRGLPAP